MRHIDLLELRIPKEARRFSSIVLNEALDLSRSRTTCCFFNECLTEDAEESVEALVELEVLWPSSLSND